MPVVYDTQSSYNYSPEFSLDDFEGYTDVNKNNFSIIINIIVTFYPFFVLKLWEAHL